MKKYVAAMVTAAVLATPALAVPAQAGASTPITGERDRDGSDSQSWQSDDRDGRDGDRDGREGDRDGRKGDRDGRRAKFRIAPGVTFNSPFGRQYTIKNKISRAIRHTPKGEKIRAMSWNFNAVGLTNDLIAAHRRGVSVRVFMARSLVNPEFRRLTNALKVGNRKRPRAMRSWTRTCSNSCRGKGGAMHSKWVTISKAGRSRKVVMQGSANLTGAAAVNQWNDWFTTVGKGPIYKGYQRVFRESTRDRKAPAFTVRDGDTLAWFAPRGGRKDLVLDMLNDVRCKGARDAGIRGRTAIRIASAVIQNSRGQRIAHKIKDLHNRGCNIRMVYTLSTDEVMGILRGVPVRHLAYDGDGDGAYDNYLHMKSMTISGNWRGDRSARVVFNGSANWSTIGTISDEQGMIVRRNSLEKKYGKWITGLYNGAPRGRLVTTEYLRRQGVEDPYAGLELELGHQG